jgi:SHS2 domain-containing protein
MMGAMAFEFLDHTADIGVRIVAESPEEFFAEAARALYAILLSEECRERVERRVARPVELEAPDGEALLVEFLTHLLYRLDGEKLLLPWVIVEEARLDQEGGRAPWLRAKLEGEVFDPNRHRLRTGVKAVTYHGLEIVRTGGKVSAEVIFDL